MEIMPVRYFLYLSYKGTNYHGWQSQPNAVGVQEVIENALSTIFGKKMSILGAGRTDAGVHAKLMIAHFDAETNISDKEKLVKRLNSILPPDISIQKIRQVRNDAHARFSAVSRTYHYYISLQKNPFTREFSWQTYGKIDVEKMNEATKVLFDYQDFTSFSKLHTDVKTNNCRIDKAEWETDGEGNLVFCVKADRFLRNMVRAIVGTLVDVGLGKLSADDFRSIIERKNRCAAGSSAPAQGLFLTDIAYPEEIFID